MLDSEEPSENVARMTSSQLAIPPAQLRRAASLIKCLGHPLRLRILSFLEAGEMTVSQLQDATRATQSAVSRQLAILRSRRIVRGRRDGVHVFYRVVDDRALSVLSCIRTEAGSD